MRLILSLILCVPLMGFMTLIPPEEDKTDQQQTESQKAETAEEPNTATPPKTKNLEGALRGFVWGLPPTVILENEKATFVGNDDGILFFLDELWERRATIGYEFMDNKLYRAKVFIEMEYYDRQLPLDDLMRIRADLVEKYGEPLSEEFVWRNEREKNYPEAWGWAIFRRELEIITKWQTDDTIITAYLGSPKLYETELSVTYLSRTAKDMLDAEAEKDFLIIP